MTWHDEKEPPVYAAGERAKELEVDELEAHVAAAAGARRDSGETRDTEPMPPPPAAPRALEPVDDFPFVEEALGVGWYCRNLECQLFNGDGKERLLRCRGCGHERPRRGEG